MAKQWRILLNKVIYAIIALLSTKCTRFINRQKDGGDYNKGQLAEAMDKPTITGDAVKHYLKLCNGKRAVAFCVSVAHAEHVAESFNLVGVPSESLDGTLSPKKGTHELNGLNVAKHSF